MRSQKDTRYIHAAWGEANFVLSTSKKITLQTSRKIGIIISSIERREMGLATGSTESCLRSEMTGAAESRVPVMMSKFRISNTAVPQGGLFSLCVLMLPEICVERDHQLLWKVKYLPSLQSRAALAGHPYDLRRNRMSHQPPICLLSFSIPIL